MPDSFLIERENDIIVITMQSENNNLMTTKFFEDYEEMISYIKSEENIKGLIIKGAGRHFSVGADVEGLRQRSGEEIKLMENDEDIPLSHIKQKSMFTILHELPFPVVSVITGFCIGSGCEIAINSNYRVCETSAKIGQPETTFGIIPALGGIARTIEVCGLSNAIELVYSGEIINAAKAYEIGWADVLCDKKEGIIKAKELINKINQEGVI